MHLLQLEIEVFCLYCQLCHVLCCASRMTADEVGDDLLTQILAPVDIVEDAFELMEELEGWLAHEVEHTVRGVFRSHLQTSADMLGDEFLCIFPVVLVDAFITRIVKQEVIAYTRTDETLLDARNGIDSTIDVKELGVVGVEILADVWMDAGRTFALMAKVKVLAMHGIHIGRRTTQVTQVPLEVWQLCDGFNLLQNAFLTARGDEFSLMGRDGAESTPSETASMQTYRELNHVVSRDAFSFIFWMRQTGVGEVEGVVKLVLCEGLIRWVDNEVRVDS